MTPHPALVLTDEVATALREGDPVVALESTIISHGMPYPRNVEMAREVEGIIRDAGAVPATIAVLHGRPRVGLAADDLELLASSGDVDKVSIRDLPYVVARGGHGATTVASTMRIAALAGIRVFVTGGLGGVHRGAQQSFDVSADLTELSTTDVAVVSAGVKSILDIGLTLETLETLGVPVLARRHPRVPVVLLPQQRASRADAGRRARRGGRDHARQVGARPLRRRGGRQPDPRPRRDPGRADRRIIDQALADMDARGIHGKDATPYLLGRIVEITGGESLEANIALVRNNARLRRRGGDGVRRGLAAAVGPLRTQHRVGADILVAAVLHCAPRAVPPGSSRPAPGALLGDVLGRRSPPRRGASVVCRKNRSTSCRWASLPMPRPRAPASSQTPSIGFREPALGPQRCHTQLTTADQLRRPPRPRDCPARPAGTAAESEPGRRAEVVVLGAPGPMPAANSPC